MTRPIKRKSKINRKTHKVCIKCRQTKPKQNILNEAGEVIEKKGFGDHDSEDGVQSICYACKNIANNAARNRNVSARIRHHTATRCLTQLGELVPDQFSANLEQYLGYKISALVKHLSSDLRLREGDKRKLRDALNDGYHIDHIRPLSLYNVVVKDGDTELIDWDEFQACWSIGNLTAIPADENLTKGAKYNPEASTPDITPESNPEITSNPDITSNPETRTSDSDSDSDL